jgi:hypothetical protein
MPGLIRGVARTAVVAGTATAVSNGVSRRQYGRWEQKAQQQQAQDYAQQQYAAQQYAAQQQAVAAQAAPAAPADPTIAKLQELANLHAQGILSDAEFSAAKAKVLGV